MNRRGFLQTDLRAGLLETPTILGREYDLIRVSRRAMATRFEVAIPAGTPNAIPAAEDALDAIDRVEDLLTVYRDDSAVSEINRIAQSTPVPVDTDLFEFLLNSAALSRESGGAFDPACGALIKTWGFFRREGTVPSPAELTAARDRSGMKHVILDTERRTVKFRKPGIELNFGSNGKGYALDVAAQLLQQVWGIRSALLSGGGSSVFAIGHPPGDPRGWPIALTHPANDGRSLGTFRVCQAGFGTSAATFQFFEYNGKKFGHLLDPRTCWPASGTLSASCRAATAQQADAWSTAFFVLGAEATREIGLCHPELAAILLSDASDSPLSVSGLMTPTEFSPV